MAALTLADSHPVAAELLERHGPPVLSAGVPASRRFEALARSIAYQQLAGRAAAAIWGRVVDLFDGEVTAAGVLATETDELRSCGLSSAKVASLVDLAEKTLDGSIVLQTAGRLNDSDVVDHLVKVRGIGPWTAQMFLIFELGRMDVWPVGDYGVRAGYAKAFGLADVPSERELKPLGDPFKPFRTVLAWWCWREMDTPGGRV